MSRVWPWLLLAFFLPSVGIATDGETASSRLVFGVYPYLSPTQIVTQFSPLNRHLSATLGRPMELRSAPDFARFIERTSQGEYDLIFTAPHMGRLAERRDGYVPIAQTGYQIEVIALAREDGPVKRLEDLRGRSLAIGAKMSMTYQVMSRSLAQAGLTLEQDVRFIQTASFSNVVEAVVRREADAGATGTLLWDTAPAEQRATVREIFRAEPVPGFLVLAHPRVSEADRQRIQKALIEFAGTAAGAGYFEVTRQIDFRPIDTATMERIDPFTAVFGLQ